MSRRINRDVKRFREIGEDSRMDLEDFIKHGQMGQDIKIPIKIIDLPKFEYDQRNKGGIGQGDAEEGDPVDADNDGQDGDEEGDPGDEGAEHEYYEMDPEEFAEELDDELGLNFEEKGQKVVETVEGAFNETRRAGPDSTLDTDHLFKQAIKRHAAMFADTEYVKEMLRVRGNGVESVWKWARENNVNISKSQIEELAKDVEDKTKYESEDDIGRRLRRHPPRSSYSNLKFRSDDERYRAPETIKEPQHNAVVINIRDVSGSMRKEKRELVERVFTPMDWYLQGKYDNVEFVYIAHDAKAWRVDRDEFFGIRSGGGTKVSSAFELVMQEVLSEYPWQSWNRFIFAAGDGENKRNDTEDNVIPMMREIKANRHAYVEVQPGGSGHSRANVANELEEAFSDDETYRVARIGNKRDVLDAIRVILDTTNKD
jgi:uncharacterized sporulation protein YeaH/YhbH (DUF444 family)